MFIIKLTHSKDKIAFLNLKPLENDLKMNSLLETLTISIRNIILVGRDIR